MAWPQPTDYNEAIQNPRLCFRDPELQAGEAVEDALGMPRPYSGNFADVYQVRGPAGKTWAVKCFTREVGSLQTRYQAISDHLRHGAPPFMVHFQYLPDGIRIRDLWYPVVKMDWVEGFTLNDFVRQHADKPQVMYRLAQMWIKLSLQLRRANMAHADLQHGNVLLVPAERASQLSLRLIDYDGMYVPALANTPSGEVGHPNYQHPQRINDGIYSFEVDRFSHLLIYTALRGLTVGGRDLWEKYDNGENLLFREVDFSRPGESRLLLDLWQVADSDLRHLLGHLLIGSQFALDRVVLLDDTVGGEGRPVALTAAQERLMMELLPTGAARLKTHPVIMPRYSVEQLVAKMDEEPLTASLPRAPSGTPAQGELKIMGSIGALPPTAHRWSSPIRSEWKFIALIGMLALGCLVVAALGLPSSDPGALGVLGGLAALATAVMVPLTTALAINAGLGQSFKHPDVWPKRHWPTGDSCPACGGAKARLLFMCRLCGRLYWVQLGGICAFAATVAILIALSQPSSDAPSWWVILTSVVRWLGRLLAAAAAFSVFLGAFEVWKLQPRLARENRIQSPAGRMGLGIAIVVPLLSVGLLLISLYW